MSEIASEFITTVPLPNGFHAYNVKSRQFVCWRDGHLGPSPLITSESVPASMFYYCHTVYWNNAGYYEMSRTASSEFVLFSRRNPHLVTSQTKRTFTKKELRLIHEAQKDEIVPNMVIALSLSLQSERISVDAFSVEQNAQLNSEEHPDEDVTNGTEGKTHVITPTSNSMDGSSMLVVDQSPEQCTMEAFEPSESSVLATAMPPLPPTPPPPSTPYPWITYEIMMFALYGTIVWYCTYFGWYCVFFPNFLSHAPVFHSHIAPLQPTFRRGEIVRIVQGTYSGRWGRIKSAVRAGKTLGRAWKKGYKVRVEGTTVYIPTSALMSLHTPISTILNEDVVVGEELTSSSGHGVEMEGVDGVAECESGESEEDVPILEFWIDRQPDTDVDLL